MTRWNRAVSPGAAAVLLILSAMVCGSASAQNTADNTAGQTITEPDDISTLLKPRITTLPIDDPARSPVTLKEALRMVGERNLTIKQAEAELTQVQAQVRRTWYTLLPTATATLTYTHLDHADELDPGALMGDIPGNMLPQSEPIVLRHQDDLAGVLTVQMPLINPVLWSSIRVARTGVDVTRLASEQVRYALNYGTAQAFYMAVMARAMIELQEEQIRSAAYQFEVATRREASGAGLRIDVLRARTALEQTRQYLDNAYLSLDTACDALAVLTGIKGLPMPASNDNPTVFGQPVKTTAPTDGTAIYRPDLETLRRSRDFAADQVRSTRMSLLPTVSGLWRGTHQFSEMSAMGDQSKTRWSIMLILNIPLFDMTSYQSIRVQRAALEKADLRLQDAEQSAAKEIRQALRDYESALRELDTAQIQVELTREALTIATRSYESGAATSLDVTDARRVSFSAEVGLLTSALKVRLSLLALWQASGEDPSRLLQIYAEQG